MYADVLIMGLGKIYTYGVGDLEVGCGDLVEVPVRNRYYRGIVLGFKGESDVEGIRKIRGILVPGVINEVGLRLAKWLANYYVCSLERVLGLFVPPPVRMKEEVVYIAEEFLPERELLLPEKEKGILKALRKGDKIRHSRELEYLVENGFVKVKKVFVPRVSKRQELVFRGKEVAGAEELLRRAPKQRELWELLKTGTFRESELRAYGRSVIKGLREKGLVEVKKERFFREPLTAALERKRPEKLNAWQEAACQKILSRRAKWLLWGVTGSGKTEVYLKIMEKVLTSGKQVLYLVPEIALTPQLVSLLVDVFGGEVAVLHSALSAGERYDEWTKIKQGRARVVLGPRSAVFAPFTNLGLIVIDEEHETTYKQSEPEPRYDARQVAEKLAELWEASLILGSATPALRTFYLAEKGEYQLLRLPYRVKARPLPEVEIIDLKREMKAGHYSIFSRKLLNSLGEVFNAGEQAILFMNRRGFHTFVMCRECGRPLTCPHCEITLIYHQAKNKLVCHYCHFERQIPKSCAFCGSTFIRYYGTGTERVAAEFKRFFPGVSFVRMDTDTTQRKDSHTYLLKEFQSGRAQVLIGTQMIAKGLDFPKVTLVGVINPDFFLNLPDYQAAERAYQLLTQVAGRAGRGEKPGQVLMQTFDPKHYLFEAVKKQDYEAFYHREILCRRDFGYPPFCFLARILVSGYREKEVLQRIDEWTNLLKGESRGKEVEFLGPGPAPLGLIKKRFRYHFLMKSRDLEILQSLAAKVREANLKYSDEPRTIIDLEPQSLL